MRIVSLALAGSVLGIAALAGAQTVSRLPADQQRQARYQVSQMERMLEGAVEHGATVIRERIQVATGAQTFVNESGENAHVRGFRLEGFGVFFDIEVPSLQGSGTLLWSFQTLDQNGLGLENALGAIRSHIEAAGDANLLQALKRVELQVAPVAIAPRLPRAPVSAAGSRPAARAEDAADAHADHILTDPQEAYRSEVQKQIVDALLDYSHPLAIGPDEWLSAGARSHIDRPLLAPADSDARTVVVSVRGRDLLAFHAGQISRDEAIKRVEVRVF